MTDRTSAPQPVFLIVDPDAFVADDLAEILHERIAGARVIQALAIDDHMMRVVSEMSVYGVFLNGTLGGAGMRTIAADLQARQVGLAWIGTDGRRSLTTTRDGDAPIVAPFTDEAVLAVIESWNRARPLPGGRPDGDPRGTARGAPS